MSKIIQFRTAKDRKCALAMACLAAVALSGCNSPGYRKSDAVALSMKSAAMEVQVESQQLQQTMGSLNKLVNQPEGDLRISFKEYSASLDRLKASAGRTQATGRRMAQKGVEYFQAWDKQLQEIDYQHVRDLSSARRTEVTNRFTTIEQRYQESQAAVDPLITYLQDIRTALNTDLTPAGVESLKGVVQNADSSADKLRTALQALTVELVNSSTRFASVSQPAPVAVKPPE